MEVESTNPNETSCTTTKSYIIHPLAIIGISDHQTRVITSSLKSTKPSPPRNMGLLFGYATTSSTNKSHQHITIIDSEDIPLNETTNVTPEIHNSLKSKIKLHQAVFPQHQVVGWYRVVCNTEGGGTTDSSSGGEPTMQDMQVALGWLKEYNPTPIFLLMEDIDTGSKDSKVDATAPLTATNDGVELEKELPLSLYEMMIPDGGEGTGSSPVFLNADFELETFDTERIAVEAVFQTKPPTGSGGSDNTDQKMDELEGSSKSGSSTSTSGAATAEKSTSSKKSKGGQSTKEGTNKNQIASVSIPPPSESELHVQSLHSSITSMNARISILLDFLKKTQSGDIPTDHYLLRQVAGLIDQLPLVMGRGIEGIATAAAASSMTANNVQGTTNAAATAAAPKMQNDSLANEFENEYDDMLIMSFYASVTKTVQTILDYTNKFKTLRVMGEKEGWGSSSGMGGRSVGPRSILDQMSGSMEAGRKTH